MTRKKKILIVIFSVIGLILGAVGGIGAYILIQSNKPQVVIEDEDAKYTTTLKETPTDGSLPTEHSATDVIAYTLYYVANSKQFKVTTTGTAKASVATQLISNERIVKDGTAMVSTISSGMVSVATQRYFFTEAENKTLTRGASKVNKKSAVWNDNEIPECISYAGMKKRYGWLPFQANGYIICDDTYLDINAITLTDNGDETYTIVFDLDPDGDKAPFWYRREIIQSSGSTMIPEFSKIHIEFTIDKNYRLLKQDIQETYKVRSMGVEATTVTNCQDTFEYEDVEYNNDYLAYFLKYKSLEPSDDSTTDEIIKTEDNITTMIVSSLQGDGSDLGLSLNGYYDDIKLSANAVLNISDLTNIKVIALINDKLYVEYNDSYLYLSINDSIKYKTNLNNTKNESDLESDSDSESLLDVNSILASLESGTVTKNGNNILIDTTLKIGDISIDLNFDINKIDEKYELNSISAIGNILGKELNINVVKTSSLINSMNHSDFIEFDANQLINHVSSILDYKLLNLNLELAFGDAIVELNLNLDFNDTTYLVGTINLKYNSLDLIINIVYDNDTIYINYDELYVSFTIQELKDLIKTDNTLDLDLNYITALIENITTLDSNKLLNDLLNLDLSSINNLIPDTNKTYDDIISVLFGGLKKLELNLNDNSSNINILYNNIGIDLSISSLNNLNHDFDKSKYVDLINIINNKQFKFEANIELDSLNIILNCAIDFKEDLFINSNILITYKEDSIELNIVYKNDIIYINYENLYASISLNELKNIIPANSAISKENIINIVNNITSIDVDSLIDSLTKLDIDSIKNLFNSNDIDSSIIESMISLLNKIKLIKNENKEEGLISYNKLNISLDIDSINEIDKSFDDSNYINIDSLIEHVLNAYNAINDNSFRIELDTELNLKDLASIDKTIYLNGNIDFILNENNQYDINANINLYAFDIKTEIGVIVINNNIYLNIAGINIMVEESDLDSLITDIKSSLGLVNNTELNIKDKVFNILESLTLASESKFSIDLTSVYEKLGVLTVLILETESNFEVEANINFASLEAKLEVIDRYVINVPSNYLDRDDIINVCEMIKSVLDISKEKEFNITLSTNIYDDLILHLNIVGDICFKIYDNGRFDFGADLVITEFDSTGENIKMIHMINIKLLSHEYFEALNQKSEDMLYITYGTNPDDTSSLIKMYTPANDILDLTATFTTLLGIDLSFLDGYSTFNFNDIDTSQLKDLFISSDNSNESKYSYKYDLSEFINSLDVNGYKLILNLDLSAIDSNNSAQFILDLNESDTYKALITIDNLFIKNTKIDVPSIALVKDPVNITLPNVDSSWFDISTIDNLVAGLLTTASKKCFEIEGDIALKLGSYEAISVPIKVKVEVYEDGSFELYARLDYNTSELVGLFGLIKNDYTEYYYRDGYIIEKAVGDDVTEVKVSTDTFFGNIPYYVFKLGMNLSSSILNQIENAGANTSDNKIDAGKVLDTYNYNDGIYQIILDLGELVNDSKIGDLEIELSSQPVVIKEEDGVIETSNALTSISKLNLNMYSVINIALSKDLTLVNLETDSKNYTRLTKVDMAEVDEYINKYSYKVGYIYKNKQVSSRISYNVTFVSSYSDNVTYSLPVESVLDYPYTLIENDGKKYVVLGWYLDSDFKEEFKSNVMPGYNLTLYAKLKEVTGSYKLYIDGNYYMDFDLDTLFNLSGAYSIYDDGIYYTYNDSDINPELLFSKYIDLFDSDSENIYFNLYSYQNDRDGYYTVELDYSNKFSDKKYIAISLPNDLEFSYDYLNVGTYSIYDVNFWFDSNNNDVYNDETAKLINTNTKLYAYYSTSSILGYELLDGNLYINDYSYTGSDVINLIFPKYVKKEDTYYIVYGIKLNENGESPFGGKTNFNKVYINDGFKSLANGSFSSCTNIDTVYFGNTFSGLEANSDQRYDAFYMGSSGEIDDIYFYLASGSNVDTSAWYCYREKSILGILGNYKYYNYAASRFMNYSGSINTIVNGLF